MNNKTNIFETKRLFLRPTSKKDIKFIFELLNSPKWIKYIGDRNINSIEDSEKYITEKIIPQFKNFGFGTYTVIKKSDNSKIGTCGLNDREGLNGIDLGFAFLPEFEKNGFAFESANKIMNVAFDKFNLNDIKAITKKENISSQKLLEKLNFNFKEIIKLASNSEEIFLYIKNKNKININNFIFL